MLCMSPRRAREPSRLDESAPAHGLRGGPPGAPLQIVVAGARSVEPLPGVPIERIADFDRVAHLHLHPPRTRLEHALLKTAAAWSVDGAIGVLADARQQRRTTPERLESALTAMTRLRHRALLLEILRDVATAAFSSLERRYLRDVERAHGCPAADGSGRFRSGVDRVFRDVEYVGQPSGRGGGEDPERARPAGRPSVVLTRLACAHE